MRAAPLTTARALSLLAPPLVLMAGIFFLSAQTSTADHSAFEVFLRKVGHVTEYLVLALLCMRAARGLRPDASLRAAVAAGAAVALAYAATDEFHQTFVTGRHGTPADVLIDSIGIALAALVYLWRGARSGAAAQPRPLPPEGGVGERLEGVRQAR
jgi:VanZ family protein